MHLSPSLFLSLYLLFSLFVVCSSLFGVAYTVRRIENSIRRRKNSVKWKIMPTRNVVSDWKCRWNRQIPRDKVWDSEKQRKTIAARKIMLIFKLFKSEERMKDIFPSFQLNNFHQQMQTFWQFILSFIFWLVSWIIKIKNPIFGWKKKTPQNTTSLRSD